MNNIIIFQTRPGIGDIVLFLSGNVKFNFVNMTLHYIYLKKDCSTKDLLIYIKRYEETEVYQFH